MKSKFELGTRFKRKMEGRILDVGCGIDPFKGLEILDNENIKEAKAIDPSSVAIEYLKKHKKHSKINYLSIKARELSELEEKFDYIFCFGSLEHFGDLSADLQGVKSALKTEGEVFFGEGVLENLKFKGTKEERKKVKERKREKMEEDLRELTDSILKRAPELSEREAFQVAISYSYEGSRFNSKKNIRNKIINTGFELVEENAIDDFWTGIFRLKR